MDPIILNFGQVSSSSPELAPSSPNFRITPVGKPLTHEIRFNSHQAHIHGGSSVESGFEPVTLRPQSRDLTARPRWPLEFTEKNTLDTAYAEIQPTSVLFP
ncbi:hypothetical protein AVEN_182551-1 [Araneus ventricosus]|uniref:Uncharacterized protein n=1 Tax=Araneus ventricosus TaxID=182803 RepID=A0A4Y2BZN3_ARAVE|nr:hypothetical protein AVEN_182551-1 [Araneus ventricosus]